MWIFEFSLWVRSTKQYELARFWVLSVYWKTSTSESVLIRVVLPQTGRVRSVVSGESPCAMCPSRLNVAVGAQWPV
jgi:hypothetical protein